MAVKCWRVLLIALPLITGMRDPFQPPEDRCRKAQLTQWYYQGAIARWPRLIGLVRNPEGKWQRVETGSELPTGWRIVRIAPQSIEIETGPGCDPARWVWSREGKKDEKMDSHSVADRHPAGVGTKTKAGNAGGG
ncbi:HofP DNA utilization family protein [Superficieibacter sp.]|uniref:HofP DNA utilization family protein n=1 Tax=Superficieibacter sp. TaxID=2303322 RepID=UPI0028B0C615|nr:HofP DNA utilization family protein [Superficieibacter sp.]